MVLPRAGVTLAVTQAQEVIALSPAVTRRFAVIVVNAYEAYMSWDIVIAGSVVRSVLPDV